MTRRPLLLLALPLAACQATGLKNPITRETPPSTVGQVTEHHDYSGIWGLNKLIAPTTSTLRVAPSDTVVADTRVAIEQYEALIADATDPRLRAEALQRAADLRLQRADAGEGEPDDVAIATAHYRRLLDEHPAHPNRDRALYQLARAQQLSGNEAEASTLLRRLGSEHPDSARSIEARFRAAELLYQARDYAAAEREYRAVLAAAPAPDDAAHRYAEPAQYKLAWALYQQQQYGPALQPLLAILDRELPRGEPVDPQAAVAAVPLEKADMVSESLRLAGLSFAALGGGIAVGEQLDEPDAPRRLDVLLHAALADHLLERQRYSDAADAWAAFIARQPQHEQAPRFQARIIDAYAEAGFDSQLIAAKQAYVDRYAADAGYWSGREPDTAVVAAVRGHLGDLARHHHALAQAQTGAAAQAAYAAAAQGYRRLLDLYPDDPQRPATRMLYAEALLDGGETEVAAREFEVAAYDDGNADAAHAAVLAWRRLGTDASGEQRLQVLRAQAESGLKLAERFPEHPQRTPVLAASAADLLELGEADRAIEAARSVLDAQPATAQRVVALSVLADAHYGAQRYAEAESAYTQLLAAFTAATSLDQRGAAVERLAASIYHQAEALRESGDHVAAARGFLRIGTAAPSASIRATADYDAAASLIAAEDWPTAARTLEGFRMRFADHELIPEVDRKLAVAYDEQGQLAAAAAAYTRIAADTRQPQDDRREAAWRAAQRYETAGLVDQTRMAYERYLQAHPQPPEPALLARQRLAAIAVDRNDADGARRWLQQIIGVARNGTPPQRAAAAEAQLQLGRMAAGDAARIALSLPVERSLPRRVEATRAALDALGAAADYGFAETTTAATYEIAALYRDLGAALLRAPRPRGLDALEAEQYTLLLEEQAYPFEESAIEAFEANLARLDQGVWNEWVQRSAAALTEMVPARYGKHERRDLRYDTPG
ncbi:tetratricopeptide repeat protein [Sinimarinibacterium flocculans]|uniref:Tetratricopeptide repeat protein n=1 Tax=Sinimarinibacterium flocculans TaxID=985250 RepID=A0A318E7M9_9GAMM|nr:tetratricopeptide repeat protein [Sinimarinibacterium flocculans]PXV64666.1 tetratricopeptide repeat protein [Sinimarinibacterium flocculans]